jgi:hypothetical protein
MKGVLEIQSNGQELPQREVVVSATLDSRQLWMLLSWMSLSTAKAITTQHLALLRQDLAVQESHSKSSLALVGLLTVR